MDKGQPPPPYPGPPVVHTNIPYQTQQVSYQTQPAPKVVYSQQSVILPTHTREAQSTAPVQVIVIQPELSEVPGEKICFHCQQQIITETKYIIGKTAWCWCIVLGISMIWPFCLIPFCLNSCKDVEHRCPNCKRIVHIYRCV